MGSSTALNDSEDLDLVDTSNTGLVAVLHKAQEQAWEGEAAQALGKLVELRIGHNLRWLFAKQRGLSLEHARLEVISQTWQVLRLHTDAVLAADDPWGYVATVTNRHLAGMNKSTPEPESVEVTPAPAGVSKSVDPMDMLESGAMVRLVRELVAIGAPRESAWKILRRCVQICAERGVTKRHAVARRDWYLEQHGLTPDQASQWMNLVTGTRRHGERESALWRLSHGMELSTQNRKWAIAAIHGQPDLVPDDKTVA